MNKIWNKKNLLRIFSCISFISIFASLFNFYIQDTTEKNMHYDGQKSLKHNHDVLTRDVKAVNTNSILPEVYHSGSQLLGSEGGEIHLSGIDDNEYFNIWLSNKDGYFVDSDNDGLNYVNSKYSMVVDTYQSYSNYLIGNFNNYIHKDNVAINFKAIDSTLGWAYNGDYHGKGNIYYNITTNNGSYTTKMMKDIDRKDGTLINSVSAKIGNNDYATFSFETKIRTDDNFALLLDIYPKVNAFDDTSGLGKDGDWIRSASYMDNPTEISIFFTMPYTNYDIENFKEIFRQTLAKPIRIKNSNEPIIFNYKNNEGIISDNEKFVLNEINKRIKSFNNNNWNLLNKFGTVVYNNGHEWVNTNDVSIYLDIPSQVRGRIGSQTCNVVFKLNNGRKFDFGDGPVNQISIPIKIYLELNPEVDLEIDELVEIIPYKSSSNDFDYYLEEKELNIAAGGNSPDPLKINPFEININKKSREGFYSLIDNDKLPIISKAGTIIKTNLQINLNGLIINKEIEFNRLFSNGELYSQITLDDNDYQNSKIKFVDKTLKFGIRMVNDKIIFFNPQDLRLQVLDSSLDTKNLKVSITIKNASATIPVEQTVAKSKWKQIDDAQFFDDKQLNYVGTFETFDPFIFKFRAKQIEVRDPITNEFIGYASKYKPFIRKGKFNSAQKSGDETIFPKPETNELEAFYEANLGTYVMKNKTEEGNLEFQIVIKEFDESPSSSNNIDDRYSKDRWIIGVSLNLLTSEADFEMTGYSDNELIKEENEKKYFNKESEFFRGDYVDEKTGMYKPKIVWVNANPPENFLYDPLDESNNPVVGENPSEDDIKRAKYDIGYIAELNATGFSGNDYSSIPTFGGYEINFDTSKFVPTGLVPYTETYTYSNNNVEPIIERTPLSQSGLQIIKSKSDFRQVVLKRPDSNNYLYQFSKIAKDSQQIIENPNIIDLYGVLKGLDNQPLFVDFFETYQGKHLVDFLVNKYKIFEDVEAVKALPYSEIMQYWNIYVNDPGNYEQEGSENYDGLKDISLLNDQFKQIILSSGVFNELKKKVIDAITQELQRVLTSNFYIDQDVSLQYNKHFKIEISEKIFDEKINQLIKNYSLPLNEAKIINFEVEMITDAFKDDLFKPTGKVTIKLFNNKNANDIINLSYYNGSKLSINTKHPHFSESDNMIALIKNLILESIQSDLIRIISSQKNEDIKNFIPTINQDYKIRFYTKYHDSDNIERVHYYKSIEEAIIDALLYEADQNVFYNTLFVEVSAIFNDQTHYMINSFHKTIINNSNQQEAIVELSPYDLSQIQAHDIKINTKDPAFNHNPSTQNVIRNLMIDRVAYDINVWARKWLQINKIELNYLQDYEIKLIKEFDEQHKPIYYEFNDDLEMEQIIKHVLIDGIENEKEFNRDLFIEVRALTNSNLEKSFIKKINNNYLNKAVEEDNLDNIILDNDNNLNDLDNTKLPQNNNQSKGDDFDWWWVVTPVTVIVLLVITLLIVYWVRKNRRIR